MKLFSTPPVLSGKKNKKQEADMAEEGKDE